MWEKFVGIFKFAVAGLALKMCKIRNLIITLFVKKDEVRDQNNPTNAVNAYYGKHKYAWVTL